MKFVIIPGNGAGDVFRANWYGWLYEELSQQGVDCALRNMPDPVLARESFWLPFLKDELNCDKNTVLIGHSSGAEAAMRYAEKYEVRGIILVSACVTDLGDETERQSGYYNRPWDWATIRDNVQFVVQFGSTDDPFIPWTEQQQVADGLKSDLFQFSDRGHFMCSQFPQLLNKIKLLIKSEDK